MFSGSDVFGAGEHSTVQDVVSSSSAQLGVSSVVNGRAAPQLNAKATSAPDMVLAFVYPELGSSDAFTALGAYSSSEAARAAVGGSALSQLAPMLEAAQSSVTVPYVYTQSAVSRVLSNAVSSSSMSSRIKRAGSECGDVLKELQDASLYGNGAVDLLLVTADSSLTAECMQRAVAYVDEATNGNFVGVVGADSSSVNVRTNFAAEAEAFPFMHASVLETARKANATLDYPGPQFVTGNILAGLVLGFSFILITGFGVCCTSYIKPPVRFAHANLDIAKEY